MTIENVKLTIKSLDSLSQLFNKLSSVYDVHLHLDDLVQTDEFGFIESVDNDLTSELHILLDSLNRMSQAINIYRDKIESTLACFDLIVHS